MATQQITAESLAAPLTKQQALDILIKGVQIAQSRGVYKLTEAAKLTQAIFAFFPPAKPVEEVRVSKEEHCNHGEK